MLVERARTGDVDAYEQLVRQHERLALRIAHVTCGSAADAEEAVQDAFVKAYRALPRFRVGAAFRPWVLAIVTNEARNLRRARGRRERLVLRVTDQDPRRGASGDAAPSPEAAVIDDETATELEQALSRLGDDDREVLACRYLLELSERETAQTLGIRVGTVKSRTSRALARLRIVMGEGEEVDR